MERIEDVEHCTLRQLRSYVPRRGKGSGLTLSPYPYGVRNSYLPKGTGHPTKIVQRRTTALHEKANSPFGVWTGREKMVEAALTSCTDAKHCTLRWKGVAQH